MTAPGRTASSLFDSAAPADWSCEPRLIMKMIFSKVGPCCETAQRAAVSLPKMRRNPTQNVLIGGKRRAVEWRVGQAQTPRQLAYAMLTSGGSG
jgi:hypothetical protein